MAKSPRMTAARRKRLHPAKFALPGKRFPLDTPGRAVSAKARATQAVKKGRMSKTTASKIHKKANAALKRFKRR